MNTSISAPDTTAAERAGDAHGDRRARADRPELGRRDRQRRRRPLQRPPRHQRRLHPQRGNRIAQPTGTSYNDSALAPGTYFYKVTAEDFAGNIGPAGNEASAVSAADTTPPTVSITAPAAWRDGERDGGDQRERIRQRHGCRRPVQARRRESRRRGHQRSRTRSRGTRSRSRTARTPSARLRATLPATRRPATNVLVTASNTGSPGLVGCVGVRRDKRDDNRRPVGQAATSARSSTRRG